jgi:hypothetical protein
MSALQQDVTIERGDSQQLVVTVTNLPSGGLAAYSKIWFTAKRDYSDSDAAAFLSLTLASGVVITTNGNATTDGVLTITIPASATASLPSAQTVLRYDVQVLDGTQNPVQPHTVAQGALTVAVDVTQSIS